MEVLLLMLICTMLSSMFIIQKEEKREKVADYVGVRTKRFGWTDCLTPKRMDWPAVIAEHEEDFAARLMKRNVPMKRSRCLNSEENSAMTPLKQKEMIVPSQDGSFLFFFFWK